MKRPARPRRVPALAAALALALAATWGSAAPAAAHRDGCHRWHSCPSDSGSYVCGDTGHFAECGYSSLPGSGAGTGSGAGADPGDSEEYDSDPPGIPTVENPTAATGGKVTLTVTAERGSTIEVRDEELAKAAEATATGSAQRITFAAEDGEHAYTVVAVDRAGNRSEATAEFTLTTDATAPEAVLAVTPADPTTAVVAVSVHGEPDATYEIRVEGRSEKTTGTLGPAGAASQDLWLPNGSYRVTASVRDAAGNTTVRTAQAVVGLAGFRPLIAHETDYATRTPALRITGPRGGKGTLTVDGARADVLLDRSGQATVPITLSDGDHTAEVTLTDPFGRRGTARSTPFTVDTTPPALAVAYDTERARYGDAVLVVTGEKGLRADIRLPDGTIRHLALTGSRQTEALDLRPGTHPITVTTEDRVGNTTRRTVDLRLSDEWTTGETLHAVLWWLGALVLLAVGGVLLWRGRRRLIVRYARWREDARVAAEERAARAREQARLRARDTYARELAQWQRERDRLAELLDLAANPPVGEFAGPAFRWGRRKTGEQVLWVAAGALVEVRTRQGVGHTERTETGEIAVTDLRVVFQGAAKRREWEYGKWLHHQHDTTGQTLITVTNRKKASGVACPAADAERLRVVIDTALAKARGERSDVADRARDRLAAHERRKPVEPAGV
ncbi:Ig-like domain-containing protein [Streptomyces sp. NPDC004520]|uniref:Ig-like domain-containing protein n=1 Tax=Streptomyces sp. NPDC004520 TaxID=3364702 RepID=UPI0036C12650